jgi:hypothetical protein
MKRLALAFIALSSLIPFAVPATVQAAVPQVIIPDGGLGYCGPSTIYTQKWAQRVDGWWIDYACLNQAGIYRWVPIAYRPCAPWLQCI